MPETTKHIVIVVNDLKGNGAERVVITLARTFKELGHHCDIICFNKKIEYDVQGLKIHFFSIKYWRWLPRKIRGKIVSIFLDRKILGLRNKNPDLILSNLLPVDRILSASRLKNVYIVLHSVLSLERNTFKGFPELQLYAQKPTVCVSDGVRKDLINLLPSQALQSVTIYNPIDAQKTRELACAPTRLPTEKFIIHVGKFKTEKRHDILLNAFAQSAYSGDLVLVGQGPLQKKIEGLANTLGIKNRVHFVGYNQNPFPLIKASELLVLTSDFEGFGMVLIEAISLDTPVISSDCRSGPSEILEPHQLYPTGGVNELAAMLSEKSFVKFKGVLKSDFYSDIAARKYLSLCD